MTTYTLQALDANGDWRDTLGVEAQSVAGLVVLRVPQHWPASEREALAAAFRDAAPKGARCLIVPDYVTAFRLVEPEVAPPAEWTEPAP